MWILLLPAVCVTTGEMKVRGRYISDKSLLPAGNGFHREYETVDAEWAAQFQFDLHQNLSDVVQSASIPPMLRSARAARDALERAGLSSTVRRASAADGSDVTVVVGTLAARSGDGKESILVVASYGSAHMDETQVSPLAVALSLVRRLAQRSSAPWLAKDVTLLLLPALSAESCAAMCASHTRWSASAGHTCAAADGAEGAEACATRPVACSPLCAGLGASRWLARWYTRSAFDVGDGRPLLPSDSLVRGAVVLQPHSRARRHRATARGRGAASPAVGESRAAELRRACTERAQRRGVTTLELERLALAHAALSGRTEIDAFAVRAPGRNGRLPNLDVLNAVNQLAAVTYGRSVRYAREAEPSDWLARLAARVRPAFPGRPAWNRYFARLVGTARFAADILHTPRAVLEPHSALLDREVDAFTLVPVVGGPRAVASEGIVAEASAVEALVATLRAADTDGAPRQAMLVRNAMSYATMLEGIIRMYSNMHEKVRARPPHGRRGADALLEPSLLCRRTSPPSHTPLTAARGTRCHSSSPRARPQLNRSFYMYLLPDAHTFISVEEYIWLVALITLPWVAMLVIERYASEPFARYPPTAPGGADARTEAGDARRTALAVGIVRAALATAAVAACAGGAVLALARVATPNAWLVGAALVPLGSNAVARAALAPNSAAGAASCWIGLFGALWLAHLALSMVNWVLAVASALALVPVTSFAFALDRCGCGTVAVRRALSPAAVLGALGVLFATNNPAPALVEFVAIVLERHGVEQTLLVYTAALHIASISAALWLVKR